MEWACLSIELSSFLEIDLNTNLQAVAVRISLRENSASVPVRGADLNHLIFWLDSVLAHLLSWVILTVTTLCGEVTIVAVEWRGF